ncbi:unnamed protein product [Hermetia illucens]|uniref:Uncharacterized protein n=1 Tax=Hermetia illucens TaxID=343691 RepID=A0A7R8UHX8_HERIL|nr:cuticle protein 16.5-like [Hermetia illucens]CAD7080877.1 unnamed protein product [Hermetia illucens]
MKFVVLAVALIGTASASLVAPLGHGYSGLGWGHSAVGGPVVASVAPAISTYSAHAVSAPVVASVAPVISSYHAAPALVSAPALTAHAVATPIISAHSGLASPVIGHGWGHDVIALDLWKKKKAAAH